MQLSEGLQLIEKTLNHTEIRKEATFLEVIKKPITNKYFKDFANHRKNY